MKRQAPARWRRAALHSRHELVDAGWTAECDIFTQHRYGQRPILSGLRLRNARDGLFLPDDTWWADHAQANLIIARFQNILTGQHRFDFEHTSGVAMEWFDE